MFLPRARHGGDRVYFTAEWSFVAPGVKEDEPFVVPPTLYLNLIASVPGLHDWRDLAGPASAESLAVGPDEEPGSASAYGPDLFIHPPGAAAQQAPDGWDTQFHLGARNGYEFDFEMKATRPSARAREAQREHELKLIHGEEIPWDWEKWTWLEEGDSLAFSGRVQLAEISCTVPINAPRPIEWAKQMARRELRLDETGFCHVNGGNLITGEFKPADGIHDEGRLVILTTVNDYYRRWQAKQKQLPPPGPAS